MARKSRGLSTAEKIHDPNMVGMELELYYLGSHDKEVPFPHVVHHFVDKNHKRRDIMGFTNLNNIIFDESNPIEKNIKCFITYMGKKNVKTAYGMKDVHQVSVETDDEDFYLPEGLEGEVVDEIPGEETEKGPF